jgi:hypothetical protein
MTNDSAISLLTTLVGLGVSVLLAGIPWAYSVHGRLATIEVSLREALSALSRVADLERRIGKLEFSLAREEEQRHANS